MFPATLSRASHGNVRRILIVALAALLAYATLAIGSTIALAVDQPYPGAPDKNNVSDWCEFGGFKDESPGYPYIVPEPSSVGGVPAGATWSLLVLKSGNEGTSVEHENWLWDDPVPGLGYEHPEVDSNSHSILCWEPGTEPVPPELTLVKNVINTGGGSADASAWTLEADGTSGGFSGNGAPATGSQATLGPNTVTADVQYTLSESGGPANYSAGSWSCTIDQGDPVVGNTITLQSGESGVCEITNTYNPEPVPPELTLVKNVINTGGGSADASAWTLEADGTSGGFSGNGAPATGSQATLGPNTVTADVQYTLSESGGPANYSAGSWSCTIDQGDPVVGNTITLQSGESGVCEITNTYNPEPVPPELTLVKNVVNTGGGSADASAWTLEADGTSGGFSGNGAPATGSQATLGPNTVTADVQYTLSESGGPANYSAGSWSCTIDQGDPVVGNTITLQSGESGVCEITNTYTAPDGPGDRPPVDRNTPRIDIEKATNRIDADTAALGPVVKVGSPVEWTYVVTNTGNVGLTDVKVVDDKVGAITCPKTTLIILEQMTCTASGKAELGQYANVGTVTGSYGSIPVTDNDPSHYSGTAVGGTAQLGDTVWLDVNKNGVQDSGEVGYNGADVILKDGDGNVVGTLTTATGPWVGFYSFVGLDAGTYTAMLDLSTIGTYKVSTATAFTVTLAEGDEYLDADFGLYEDAAPPTTTVPPEETLPTTGLDSDRLIVAAIGLLTLGALGVLASRRRGIEDQ